MRAKPLSGYAVSILIALTLAISPALAASALAARTTVSATVNGVSSVTVAPGDAITVEVTGTLSSHNNWLATEWLISDTPPGSTNCEDTANHNSNGTYSESFSVNAPTTPGTYNLYARIDGSNSCSSAQQGSSLTLPDAVTVVDTSGSIEVCKMIVDDQGNISDGTGHGGTFTVEFTLPSGDAGSAVFTTPLTLNTKILSSSEGNDAECQLHSDLSLGTYNYGKEVITGDGWGTPKYNDQFNSLVSTLDDLQTYNSENLDADGNIVLTSDRPSRELVILNLTSVDGGGPQDNPQCSDGIDNDNDGLIDAADPACHTDGNAENSESYDSSLNNESNDPVVDACPNIEGIQESVPEGYHLDEGGQCVADDNGGGGGGGGTGGVDHAPPISTFDDSHDHQVIDTEMVPLSLTGNSIDVYSGVASAELTAKKIQGVDAFQNYPSSSFFDVFNRINCSSQPTPIDTELTSLNLVSVNSVKVTWDHTWAPQPADSGIYCFEVSATDNAGNVEHTGYAGPIAFVLAPQISGEAANPVTESTLNITWDTDHPATSRVVYDMVSHPTLGAQPNYGYAFSSVEQDNDPKVTSHSVTLTGLTPGATYYYRVISHGSPESVGGEKIFTPSTSSTSGSGGGGSTSTTQGQVLGASTSIEQACTDVYLKGYIKFGGQNDSDQVKKLQVFLNNYMGEHLDVTGIYDQSTRDAVNRFQVKYWQDVLAPWVPFGLVTDHTPTGYVYKTTMHKINTLNCPSLDLSMPTLP